MIAFWKFVAARQAAFWRKQRGEGPPFSDDPALARYHFCNVYREADVGTRWYQGNRNSQYRGDSDVLMAEEIWSSICYRLVNRVSTFETFGYVPTIGETEGWLTFLANRMAASEKIFTGRHLNRGYACYYATLTFLSVNRGERLHEVARGVRDAPTLRAATKVLLTIPNVGPFYAWQIACDLLESDGTRSFNLPAWPDRDDYAVLGPGALAGARLVRTYPTQLLLPQELLDELTWGCEAIDRVPRRNREECLIVARALVAIQAEALRIGGVTLVPPDHVPGPMSLKNVEHALCEYARYVRASDPTLSAGLEVKPWAR